MKRALNLGCLLLIPACVPQKTVKSKAAFEKKAAFSLQEIQTNIDVTQTQSGNLEIEAKLIDVPLMMGSTLLEDRSSISPDNQMALTWACQYDQTLIHDFYLQEMESLGWQRLMDLQSAETMLVFQKPKKMCVISLRPVQNKNSPITLIHLFVSSSGATSAPEEE